MRRTSPYDREIAALAIPTLATLVAEPLYVLADTAVVGRLGTEYLAGLAVASSVLLLIHAVFVFLAYGTTATVSRLIGAGRPVEALEHTIASLWVAGGAGVVVAAAVFVTAPGLLGLLGAEGAVADHALVYLRVSLFGLPFLLMSLASVGYLRGVQDTTTPLRVTAAAATGNLVLELVLIGGFGLSIGASAFATVVAQTGAAAAYVRPILRDARRERVDARPRPRVLISLARDGAALVLRTTALRGALVMATAVAARMGTVEVAAHQIAFEIWSLAALALDAVAIAGQALTGLHLGAGSVERARGAARRMIGIDIVLGLVIGALLLVTSMLLPRIFTADTAVISLTSFVLVHVALQQPLSGLVFALDGILIGAGDLRWLAGAMVAATAIFALCAGFVATAGLGLGWLWGCIWILLVARAIPLVIRFRSERWIVTGA